VRWEPINSYTLLYPFLLLTNTILLAGVEPVLDHPRRLYSTSPRAGVLRHTGYSHQHDGAHVLVIPRTGALPQSVRDARSGDVRGRHVVPVGRHVDHRVDRELKPRPSPQTPSQSNSDRAAGRRQRRS